MASVLLVEDVPLVRLTFLKFLERGGHTATVCSGGDEAWSCVRKNRFDVVVTDLWMINGDGLEFIKRLRASGDGTPIIATTGGDPRSTQSSSIDAASKAGANRVLMKPVTKDELLDAIRECIPAGATVDKG
jgi:CheY-like chemotaxis protein